MLLFDHDARIALQRYIADVTRASYTPNFTFLRFETFTCGGQRHEVAIFRNNLFANALGLLDEDGWASSDTTDISCEFVLVPAGSFLMGNPHDEGPPDERPRRPVNVSSFLLARTQCTQAVWGVLMGRSIRDQKDLACPDWPLRGEVSSNPVYYVSWGEIQEFEEATGLRLPSESEWEYACRAGTTTDFCFGDNADDLGDYAWYRGNAWCIGRSSPRTHPVGEKLPNAFGLFDMHGNVWEWCEDHRNLDNYYDEAPTDGSAWTGGDSYFRVARGGSWVHFANFLQSSVGFGYDLDDREDDIGFRPACSIGRET